MRSLTFLKTLGAGAVGTVYLAELSSGQGFRRQVAVKVLHKDRPDSDLFLTRIRDEARLLGLLQDDAILKVLDMVQVNGQDAVILEYVEGADLDSILEGAQSPSPRGLAELGAAVAGALSRAHTAVHPATGVSLDVIHRDVKPGNIMVTRSGGVKLLDFGVARAAFDARESRTGQFMLGTLNYMAPEYVVTGEVSPAADVYGLGLSLWQLATGEVYGQPKLREDEHRRRLEERLGRIRDTHGELVAVLEGMLAWEPAARPSAARASQDLSEAADRMRGSSLRTWATRVVPRILADRKEAPDAAGLVGMTLPIGTVRARPSQAPTMRLDNRVDPSPPPGLHLRGQEQPYEPSSSPPDPAATAVQAPWLPQRPDDPSVSPPPARDDARPPSPVSSASAAPSPRDAARSASRSSPPAPRSAPSSPRPRKRRSRRALIATLTIVLQGLLIGGFFGLLGVAAIAFVLFYR